MFVYNHMSHFTSRQTYWQFVLPNHSYLGGDDAPYHWQGSLNGLKYKIGGSFNVPDLTIKAHITTHNARRKTYNVIGYIEGAVEPGKCLL